jgi:hypothetical protein
VRLKEHSYNWNEGRFGKSKLALLAYEERNMFDWTQASFLQCESNATYRIYKETAHMLCSNNPISQPSLETPVTSMWFFLIGEELKFDLG